MEPLFLFFDSRAQFVSQGSPDLGLKSSPSKMAKMALEHPPIDGLPSEGSNFRQPRLITGRSIRFHPCKALERLLQKQVTGEMTPELSGNP